MLGGGWRGECELCGAGYGIERLRELAAGAGLASVPLEDPEREYFEIRYGTLVKYYGASKVVRIPDGVVKIGCCAFLRNSFIKNVTIPNGVQAIEKRAFSGCSSLQSVNIPNGVIEIGERAFYGCNLESVDIPNGVTSIEYGAFQACKALKSVSIPDSVVEIGDSAFCMCSSLTSVDIPNSVGEIGDYAFRWCENLSTVNIENPMCKVADNAFQGTVLERRKVAERTQEQERIRRAQGLCQHCGGTFSGLFSNKTCSQCGKPKDY